VAKVVDPDGKSRTVTLSGYAVAALVPELDVNDHFRAALPAAVAGARRGDSAPLARLLAGGPVGPPPDPLPAINPTLALATSCEEDVLPFDRTAAPADRIAQARQQLAAIPPSAFDPFGPDIAFLLSNVPRCAYWPMLPEPPSFGDGAPADVPVLLIRGEFDLRSTRASTTAVAQEFPHSRLFTVPNAGHSASRRAAPNCARTAVIQYLSNGTAPAACHDGKDPFAPRPLVPRSVKAAGGAKAAARLTVEDAFEQLDVGSGGRAELESKVKGGGLRGGSFRGKPGGRLVLRRYVFVKGFPVSGTVSPHGVVVLKVPHRTLRFKPGSKLRRRTIAAALDG
jgi:hypothetical protein